jgi:hypothetical protein
MMKIRQKWTFYDSVSRKSFPDSLLGGMEANPDIEREGIKTMPIPSKKEEEVPWTF